MLNSILYSINELDTQIQDKLAQKIESIKGINFAGAEYNEINYKRLLVFYDNELFDKASLGINLELRWINAYYWYSVYLSELLKQNISIENHKQARFKLIEKTDHCSNSDFDWSIIENIDKELKIG